jgi:hypothetical protein
LQGAELSVGFAVNGVAMSPDGSLLGKSGASPGDQLVLTKALGPMEHLADQEAGQEDS